jgi:hypothetical protein
MKYSRLPSLWAILSAFVASLIFTPAIHAAVVTTPPANPVSTTNATLNAMVNPGGAATMVYFEYGLTSDYGSFSGTNSLIATNTALAASSLISNLLPGMLYHFRAVASNVGGVVAGSDLTFTTAPAAPTVIVLPAIVLGTNAANGLLSFNSRRPSIPMAILRPVISSTG